MDKTSKIIHQLFMPSMCNMKFIYEFMHLTHECKLNATVLKQTYVTMTENNS